MWAFLVCNDHNLKKDSHFRPPNVKGSPLIPAGKSPPDTKFPGEEIEDQILTTSQHYFYLGYSNLPFSELNQHLDHQILTTSQHCFYFRLEQLSI